MPMCSSITVEPVLFFFMLSVFMQFAAFQDLQYTKVCYKRYNATVCEDLYAGEHASALDWVQSHASYWSLAATLALSLPAIVVSSLLGSWSDSLGRKLPMAVPSVGGAASAAVYLAMSLVHEAPIEFILVGCFLTGICGGFSGCTMATMSYVADVSSEGGRTARVMVLEGMVFLGGTLGPLLVGWLLPLAGRAAIFALILASHLTVIAYVALVLPQVKRNPEEAAAAAADAEGARTGLLSVRRMQVSVRTCLQPREQGRRARLLLYLAATTSLMVVENGEMTVLFFKLKDEPLEWEASWISYYVALRFGMGSALLLLGGPLLLRKGRAGDAALCLVGLVARAASLFLLGFSTTSAMVWAVPFVSATSFLSTPSLRSLISKQINTFEVGKVFACMSMLENVCLLLGSAIFNTLYPAVRDLSMPGITFYVAALLLVLPASLVWYATKINDEPQK